MEQETLQRIELSRIQPSNNVRKSFNDVEVQELAESIKSVGLINPITVRPLSEFNGLITGDKFEIVAGERRFRACKAAKLDSMMAFVRHLSDQEVLEVQIIENLQRSEVHPLDEAEGFDRLIKSGRYTKETIGEKVGKSASYVIKRIQLLKLNDKIQKAFYENKFTLGHAIELARLSEDQQKTAFKWMETFSRGMSLTTLKDYIKREFHLDLSEAVFDTTDENLLKGISSCINCPKRSGYNSNLFDDIENKDICTDPKCHEKKVQASIQSKIDSYAKKDKVLKKISPEWSGKREDVIYRGNYIILYKNSKKCESTEDAIVINNPYSWDKENKVGSIKKICADKKCKVHQGTSNTSPVREMTPKQKKEAEEQELQRKIDAELEKVIVNKLINKISWPVSSDIFLELGMFLFDSYILDNSATEYLSNHNIQPSEEMEDEDQVKQIFQKADDNERIKIVFELIYWDKVSNLKWRAEDIEPTLKRNKLNLKSIRESIEKEFKAEKEKAADKPKNKSKKKTK